jgi:hypothetical protein
LYISKRKAIKPIIVIIREYQFYYLCTKCYPTSCCQGSLHMQRKLLGNIREVFYATDHRFCTSQIPEKKWEHNKAMHQLLMDFKIKLMIQLGGRPYITFSLSFSPHETGKANEM